MDTVLGIIFFLVVFALLAQVHWAIWVITILVLIIFGATKN